MKEWVQIADKLPPINKDILICYNSSKYTKIRWYMSVGYLGEDFEWYLSDLDMPINNGDDSWFVYYWQELPENPN